MSKEIKAHISEAISLMIYYCDGGEAEHNQFFAINLQELFLKVAKYMVVNGIEELDGIDLCCCRVILFNNTYFIEFPSSFSENMSNDNSDYDLFNEIVHSPYRVDTFLKKVKDVPAYKEHFDALDRKAEEIQREKDKIAEDKEYELFLKLNNKFSERLKKESTE